MYSANPAWQIDMFFIWPLSNNITGSFKMLVNGTALTYNNSPNLPYNINSADIATLLNNFYRTK